MKEDKFVYIPTLQTLEQIMSNSSIMNEVSPQHYYNETPTVRGLAANNDNKVYSWGTWKL